VNDTDIAVDSAMSTGAFEEQIHVYAREAMKLASLTQHKRSYHNSDTDKVSKIKRALQLDIDVVREWETFFLRISRTS
jgi:hypothetical protein